MLARTLQHDVSHPTRVKGVRYFRSGAVTRVESTATGVTAVVRGTYDYRVNIDRDSGGFVATCECPFFADRQEICKHIWAVVLTPDAERMLAAHAPIPAQAWIDPGEGWIEEEMRARAPAASSVPPERWQHFLGEVRRTASAAASAASRRVYTGEIVYVIDVPASISQHAAVLAILTRTRKRDGTWAKPKPLTVTSQDIHGLPVESDREVLSLLRGAESTWSYSYGMQTYPQPHQYTLRGLLEERFIPLLARTGRLHLGPEGAGGPLLPIALDEGPAWQFDLNVVRGDGGFRVDGAFVRNADRLDVHEVPLVVAGGFLFTHATVSRFAVDGAWPWLVQLRRTGSVLVPATATDALLETLAHSGVDAAHLPPELRYDVVDVQPRPGVLLRRQSPQFAYGRENLEARLQFEYEGTLVHGDEGAAFDRARRRLFRRDHGAEAQAHDRLAQLGFRKIWSPREGRQTLGIPADQFPRAVRALVQEDWRVEAEGRLFRAPRDTHLQVKSGIDWFELHGQVEFEDGLSASLPQLLAAFQRGDGTVMLDDGTRGLLPEDWARRFAGLASFGEPAGDHVRYRQSQAALLDALIAAQPSVAIDEAFARVRSALQTFSGIGPLDPPASFHGELREYQREALGWFEFLRRFGFGGCLADDMGLGKTVMVLAMLEARRTAPGSHTPSLVVVPRSLVFNWIEEAARFAPQLRVLDYTGADRSTARVHEYDVLLTTYGTLRRDATQLKDVEFDYAILDEAQAIKNATTASAKSARLLQARHRLALSGTPVENHLGELWSLFEFLNPGFLGTAAAFGRTAVARAKTGGEELELLSRAVRPFILRRTKTQVAPELPERNEQTIHCDLDPAQRKLYDELRTHYRRTLLSYVDRHGLAQSKIQVLEALLRLRQAACHAGLVDARRAGDASAKFDVLLPMLAELIDEGHKALVFSQFTSLLALLRPRLDNTGIRYEYLDGRTRDRASRVQRFQSDPECALFLISLKAGGLGLNLTGAEYVFLLDPWWNPAVEAQAIDRTHRIGQTRHVFAYRLIARDTVEEKVAALQQTKRELADAILTAGAGLARTLTREDLEWLVA